MSHSIRTVDGSLTMVRYSTTPENYDEGRCLACDGSLDLHQPDVQFPDRILGVCERCGNWYLINLLSGTDEALMVAIPDGQTLLNALMG
jgi:hypothetical protein